MPSVSVTFIEIWSGPLRRKLAKVEEAPEEQIDCEVNNEKYLAKLVDWEYTFPGFIVVGCRWQSFFHYFEIKIPKFPKGIERKFRSLIIDASVDILSFIYFSPTRSTLILQKLSFVVVTMSALVSSFLFWYLLHNSAQKDSQGFNSLPRYSRIFSLSYPLFFILRLFRSAE